MKSFKIYQKKDKRMEDDFDNDANQLYDEDDDGNAVDTPILINTHNSYNIPLKGVETDSNNSIRLLPNIPKEVITLAIDIANKLYRLKNHNEQGIQIGPKVLKKDSKDKRDFVCVFAAFNELGFPVDQEYVAELISFPKNMIDKAFKENSLTIQINPMLLSKFYIKKLNDLGLEYKFDIDNIAEEIGKIIDLCNKTIIGKHIISGNPAKNTAIGALYLYLTIYNSSILEVFKPYLASAWYISPTSYKRYYEQISKAYNTIRDSSDGDIKVWYEKSVN